jgi:hypothetical protein
LEEDEMTNPMPTETLEEAVCAQEQMEDLARLAHDVKTIVLRFEDAFHMLQDYPADLFGSLCQLTDAADAVASITLDWAQVSNADFDPNTPSGQRE